MTDKYREQWERLGEIDPYWAVLANPDKIGNLWKAEEFFITGEQEIGHFLSKSNTYGFEITFDTALDFGCGVGRLSRALAKRFRKVTAVDISSSMLKEARNANNHIENIEFLHCTSEGLPLIPDCSIDFLYSNLVLQHMPRNRQVITIKEFCRVLRPGGVLIFQTPSSYNFTSLIGWSYMLLGNTLYNRLIKRKGPQCGLMEMHLFPKNSVLEILCQNEMKSVRVERLRHIAHGVKGYMYYAKKG